MGKKPKELKAVIKHSSPFSCEAFSHFGLVLSFTDSPVTNESFSASKICV